MEEKYRDVSYPMYSYIIVLIHIFIVEYIMYYEGFLFSLARSCYNDQYKVEQQELPASKVKARLLDIQIPQHNDICVDLQVPVFYH